MTYPTLTHSLSLSNSSAAFANSRLNCSHRFPCLLIFIIFFSDRIPQYEMEVKIRWLFLEAKGNRARCIR
ncbi:hypothetical protein AKJ16_DCAP03789 [Drosera capensis]